MLSRTQLIFIAIFASFGLFGCGAANMMPGEAGVVGDASWLYGNWSGTYTRVNPANGSELYTTAAKANFTGRDQATGQFRIEMPERGESLAIGSFQSEGSSLYFGVNETNALALFGAPGDTSEYTYELTGRNLLIFNRNGTFDLSSAPAQQTQDPGVNPTPRNPDARGPVPGADGDGDDDDDAASVPGAWTCVDATENTWQFNIQSTGEFRIDVTTTSNATLWMTGSYVVIDPATASDELKPYNALLTANASNQAAYKALKLFVALKEKQMEVTIPNQGEDPTVFMCDEKK